MMGGIALKHNIRTDTGPRGVGSSFRIPLVQFVRCSKCQDGASVKGGAASRTGLGLEMQF